MGASPVFARFMRTVNAKAARVLPSLYTDTGDRDMSKLRGNAPAGEEVWTTRGELRNPADRSDQSGQWALERTEEAAPAASVEKPVTMPARLRKVPLESQAQDVGNSPRRTT